MLTIMTMTLATLALAAPSYTYTVDGKAADTKAALAAALAGKSVTRCQPVEATASKSGTSIGLKAKKAKTSQN